MIGIITGSGFYNFAGLDAGRSQMINSPYGPVFLYNGELEGKEVVYISRHGENHKYLSNQVNHRANMLVFQQYGVEAIFATSSVGVINEELELGQIILPNELYFPDNRLPNGETCTVYNKPSMPGRGHAVCDSFFNTQLVEQVKEAAKMTKLALVEQANYACVNGPRFNSKSEIFALKNIGIDILSQTLGPEAVLAAELEIPYGAITYGIDYANGIKGEHQISKNALEENVPKSRDAMYKLLLETVRNFKKVDFEGFIHRFES